MFLSNGLVAGLSWVIIIRCGFFVFERGVFHWEKFAPFFGFFHVYYEFGDKFFVFLF
jgi:hypothetical protein